jgi:hypothetical protein
MSREWFATGLLDRFACSTWGLFLGVLVVLGLSLAACGTTPALPEEQLRATPEDPVQPTVQSEVSATAQDEVWVSPLTQYSPLPTPTLPPSPTPVPTLRPTPVPGQLVLLHTNDNWGETEPCG